MGDEVRRCEVCGESECWALADWSMGGAPGEYEEAMAKHYRLGYEREKARAEKAEREVEAVRETYKGAFDTSQEALAAARRELSFLATAAGRLAVLLDGVVDWDAQGEDDGIAINAVGAVARRVGVVTPEEFRQWDYSAALAAPAAGEEGA